MKQIDGNLLKMEEKTKLANEIKEMVLSQLVRLELLPSDVAEEFCEEWQIIMVKSGWFKTWCNKFNQGQDGYMLRIVNFKPPTP